MFMGIEDYFPFIAREERSPLRLSVEESKISKLATDSNRLYHLIIFSGNFKVVDTRERSADLVEVEAARVANILREDRAYTLAVDLSTIRNAEKA